MCAMSIDSKTSDKVLRRMLTAFTLRTEIEALTDGQLADEIIGHVWGGLLLYTREGILVDEAIRRLRRADIQRRWNDRAAKRGQGGSNV